MDKLITGTIFDIQRFSLHDGPGIRTTIFLKGCPLDCTWCHNPESKKMKIQISYDEDKCTHCASCVEKSNKLIKIINGHLDIDYNKGEELTQSAESCVFGALKLLGEKTTAEKIINIALKDLDYYNSSNGGITISGGEPLYQEKFTLDILKLAKENNISTCLETCGYASKQAFLNVLPYVDIFLYDYKLSTDEEHYKYTKTKLKPILDNLKLLNDNKARIYLRCPIIPSINDNLNHFKQIVKLAEYGSIEQVELMPYHSMGQNKAKHINVQYPNDLEFAKEDEITNWNKTLISLGCKKLVNSI